MFSLKELFKRCPDAGTLAAYFDGNTGVDGDRNTQTERHLAACDSCREAALLFVETEEASPSWGALNRALMTALGKEGDAVRFVVRIGEKTLDILAAAARPVALELAPAGALRGSATHDNTFLYATSRGLYNIYLAFEKMPQNTLGMSVSLKGPKAENGSVVFCLTEREREVASVHGKRGAAMFDAIPPGDYRLDIRESQSEIASIHLNLTV